MMTVDSAYKPEVKERDDEVVYSFEIESLGDEAMRVYLVDESNNLTRLFPNE